MAGPLIVTAELGPSDFGWLNDLRRRHYPDLMMLLGCNIRFLYYLPTYCVM